MCAENGEGKKPVLVDNTSRLPRKCLDLAHHVGAGIGLLECHRPGIFHCFLSLRYHGVDAHRWRGSLSFEVTVFHLWQHENSRGELYIIYVEMDEIYFDMQLYVELYAPISQPDVSVQTTASFEIQLSIGVIGVVNEHCASMLDCLIYVNRSLEAESHFGAHSGGRGPAMDDRCREKTC